MNLDLIPSAAELHYVTIDAERAKRQEKGLEVIRDQLHRTSEFGLHEITLQQDYMLKTYSLDAVNLMKIFYEKGYKVTSKKDGFGYTESITIRW